MTAIDTMIKRTRDLLADLEAYKAAKAEADRQTRELVRWLDESGVGIASTELRRSIGCRQAAKHS